MDNKIYITNLWHTRKNYGANLTAFALQNILKELQYEPILVNNPTKKNEHRDKKYKFAFKFQSQNFKVSKFIDNTINFLNNDCSIFITGSDQVFRPKYTQNKPYQYWLDFVKPDKKKIAFSASFGVNKEQFLEENSPDTIEHIKNSLKSFDFISVREKDGVDICREVLEVNAEWIIDPVFILEKENYNKLIEKSTKNYQNKIVSYVLDTSKEYDKAYKFLSKKYKKHIVKTMNTNISIENWLSSIRDCDLFITDSFHGMCFAIIFNKPFICLANKKRGSSRFNSICDMLGIEYQCIENINEIITKDCIFKIDYNKVNEKITNERQKGLLFLKKALESPTQLTQEKKNTRMMYLETRVNELEKQNNLSYQLWQIWKNIFIYFPKPIKKIINFIWQNIKNKK